MADDGEDSGPDEVETLVKDWTSFMKFPKIEQYRSAVNEVKWLLQKRAGFKPNTVEANELTLEYPTLTYAGTVKLHGTNCGIVVRPDGTHHVQSRNRILSVGSDNAGFAAFVESAFPDGVRTGVSAPPMAIYGEWCGKGIQKGVAVAQLSTRFVVFAVKKVVDDVSVWLSNEDVMGVANAMRECSTRKDSIYCIFDYPTWSVTIPFSPEGAQEASKQLEEITLAVEEECPFGKAHGVSGIGEGVVWRCTTEGWRSPTFWFKVKGGKHQATKGGKGAKGGVVLAPAAVEKMKSAQEFADRTCSDSRLQQGIDYLREQQVDINKKAAAQFVKWLVNDILTEERDTLEASGLTAKDVTPLINKIGGPWFVQHI